MKKIITMLVFLMATAVLAATDQGSDSNQDRQDEKVRPAPAAREEVINKSSRHESWPQPFLPSEKIGADSVVSFPADI